MLLVYKTAVMQCIQQCARYGYYYFNSGIVEAERLKAFNDKLTRRYKMNRSRAALSKDRKKGRPVVKLFIYPCPEYYDPNGFQWFLMSTLPLEKEPLYDIRQTKMIIGSDFQLIRQTKPGCSHPVWTWQMTKDRYKAWEESLLKQVKWKEEKNVLKITGSIAKAPHFSGIRMQRYKLWKTILKTWVKTHKKNTPAPELPFNKYKRIVKVIKVKQIKRFTDSMKTNNRSAEAQMRLYRRNIKIRDKRSQLNEK